MIAPLDEVSFALCPLCGQTARAPFVSFPQLDFVQCDDCSLVYKSREQVGLLPADFYERSYFHGRKSGREKRFEHRAIKAASWVSDALECLDPGVVPLRTGARLLDVGCSLGYVLEGAQRLGLSSAGVDVSAYAVNISKERGYEARLGTADDLPFDAGGFDIAVLKHVLEHTPTPQKALFELKRVLRSHGVVLIAVPDVRYWKGEWQRKTYRYYRPDDLGAQHFVYYSAATLARLLTENGFQVRFSSKAVFRITRAARSRLHFAWEHLRFAALSVWVAIGRTLRMQREVYMIASKTE